MSKYDNIFTALLFIFSITFTIIIMVAIMIINNVISSFCLSIIIIIIITSLTRAQEVEAQLSTHKLSPVLL